MKVMYEKEMFTTFMEYFKKLLEGYMTNEDEDIFIYLMRKLAKEIEPTMKKILGSLQFLSFYYGVNHIKKTKVITERENVFYRIEEFRKILIEFLKSDTFPDSILEESIYSSEIMKSEDWIFENFPKVYDNPDKLLNGIRKEVNKVLIKSIKDITFALDEIGSLKGMLSVANLKSKRHYVEKLKFEMGEPIKTDIRKELLDFLKEEDKLRNPKTVYELFSYKYLEGLKTQDLVFINLFWVNKFAKMVENLLFYSSFFANRKTLLVGVKRGDIDKETLLHFLDNDKMEMKTENILFELKKIYEQEEYKSLEYDMEDMYALIPMYEVLAASYILKDLCFFSALETEGDDKSIKNYGVVEASKFNSYTFAYVWDIPHMNLPITIHCNKSTLFYYFEKIRKENKIRTYIGYDDFFAKDKLWKNSFLYPIAPEKVEYIREKAKLNNQLKHILFLQTGIWPEHLRDKKGKVTKHYISIDSLK